MTVAIFFSTRIGKCAWEDWILRYPRIQFALLISSLSRVPPKLSSRLFIHRLVKLALLFTENMPYEDGDSSSSESTTPEEVLLNVQSVLAVNWPLMYLQFAEYSFCKLEIERETTMEPCAFHLVVVRFISTRQSLLVFSIVKETKR